LTVLLLLVAACAATAVAGLIGGPERPQVAVARDLRPLTKL
jgi:hypothetical protein